MQTAGKESHVGVTTALDTITSNRNPPNINLLNKFTKVRERLGLNLFTSDLRGGKRVLATEKAKRFVAQLNEQMKLYPEGYDATKMMSEEQRGQYVEQKEVMQ